MMKNNDELHESIDNMLSNLSGHIREYKDFFISATEDSSDLSELYISGLIKTERGKRNMERMHEELDMLGDGYQQIQQFITDSPWDAFGLIRKVAQNTSNLYADQQGYDVRDVGYIIDESSHLKKGEASVGVSRQYAGVIGKVDNCQVGVYSSLVWQSNTSLINCRLFLPECWTEDDARCQKAGIPENRRVYKTKPQLALEMLKSDIEAGVRFGWVGGDGLYGHGNELNYAIEDMGLTFLLDIHKDQAVYMQKPTIFLPEKKPGRGRTPTRLRTLEPTTIVDDYRNKLDEKQWEKVEVRETTKGTLKLFIHTVPVWVWDEEENHPRERVLVISRNDKEKKIKYSLSNADMAITPLQQFAYMQAQRYWIERSFQDSKSELGMSDYQVRKWSGWHHHMALVILAMSFIVKERVQNKTDYPLLSCRDIRIMIIALLIGDNNLIEKRKLQMEFRHRQRYKDIQRYMQK
jgi:SRSO17 transposase